MVRDPGRRRSPGGTTIVRRVLLALVLASSGLLATPAGADPAGLVSAELVRKAQAAGAVRVLVRLAARTVPEGDLATPASVLRQRGDIAAARSAVLHGLRGVAHRLVRRYQTVPFLTIEASADALRMLEAMRGLVVDVAEDVPQPPALAQSGPLVGAPAAWSRGLDGAGTVIAVLDTGVDRGHPFLAGKVVEEACFSSTAPEQAAVTLCPNGGEEMLGPGAAVPCTLPGCHHGTHVAGIAAGRGPQFSGVARNAAIIAVQVFSRFTSAAACHGAPPCIAAFQSDSLAAMEWVHLRRAVHTIAAVNLSLGGIPHAGPCDSDPHKPIIDNLRSVGVASTIASGNDGRVDAVSAPACISTAVSVGSTTKTDTVAPTTNVASFLSLFAPGESITSANPGGGFRVSSGTSMAAPHVAGAFAILRQAGPGASVSTMLGALQGTGVPIADVTGITRPRIRIAEALAALADPIGDFVSGFYRNALGREPDPMGLAAWSRFVAEQCAPDRISQVAHGFFDSLEFRTARPLSLAGLVAVLYRTFLAREPEPEGLAAWAEGFRQVRLWMAVHGFLPSGEFQHRLPDPHDQAAVTALVTQLYAEVLGRSPDAPGLGAWVSYVVATGDVEGLARGFLGSAEFESRPVTLQGYVRILYRAFLDREPDPAGLEGWEGVLRGHLLATIDGGFIPSAEFQARIPEVCAAP